MQRRNLGGIRGRLVSHSTGKARSMCATIPGSPQLRAENVDAAPIDPHQCVFPVQM